MHGEDAAARSINTAEGQGVIDLAGGVATENSPKVKVRSARYILYTICPPALNGIVRLYIQYACKIDLGGNLRTLQESKHYGTYSACTHTGHKKER